jgi:hypothetical protein
MPFWHAIWILYIDSYLNSNDYNRSYFLFQGASDSYPITSKRIIKTSSAYCWFTFGLLMLYCWFTYDLPLIRR